MELNSESIPWGESKNCLFLNPKLPVDAQKELFSLAKKVIHDQNLQQHLILASSGSTVADPRFLKLVFISQTAFLAGAASVGEFLKLSKSDTWLQCLPRFHVGGLAIEARQKVSGCQLIAESDWNLLDFQLHCIKNDFAYVSLVPTQLFDLVQAGVPAPPGCRAIILGGGTAPSELLLQARQLNWKILFSYGMTETSSMVSLSENEFLNPLNGVEFEVNPAGFLGIRGPSLASLTARADAAKELISKEGFYWTQDQVRISHPEASTSANMGAGESKVGITPGSRIQILGRKDDFIKIGGEGTDLAALRNIWDDLMITSKLGLGRAVLVARPSARLGHEIELVIEKSLESQQAQLQLLQQRFAKVVLPNQKIRQMLWLEKIPKSELGKILWTQLEQILSQRGDHEKS